MSRTVYYARLGEDDALCPLDLDQCGVRIPWPGAEDDWMHRDETTIVAYLMNWDGHWIEHRKELDYEDGQHSDTYREVHPCYLVQSLLREGLPIPDELALDHRIVGACPGKSWGPRDSWNEDLLVSSEYQAAQLRGALEEMGRRYDANPPEAHDTPVWAKHLLDTLDWYGNITLKPLSELRISAILERMRELMENEPEARDERGDRSLSLTPRRREILEILEVSKTRLTRSRLLAVMEGSNLTPSEHTVRIELANMMDAGWIDNHPKSDRAGTGSLI